MTGMVSSLQGEQGHPSIPYYSSEDDIRSFFEGCGNITALDCMTFPETGKFRCIAILTFKSDAAAQRALALDGADMGGFYLKIQPYRSNREIEDFAPKMIEGYNRILYIGGGALLNKNLACLC